MKLKRYRDGRGIRRVIKDAKFILKIKGKSDAKKGNGVIDSFINMAKAKCNALENAEVLLAENFLCDVRDEGERIAKSLEYDKKLMETIPVVDIVGNSAQNIRSQRKSGTQRANITATIKTRVDRLVSIHALIVDVSVCMEQRISKMRNLCSEKLEAYILGVRKVMPDFNCNIEYADFATKTYVDKHEKKDKDIENIVAKVYVGGTQNEVV